MGQGGGDNELRRWQIERENKRVEEEKMEAGRKRRKRRGKWK